MSKESQRIKAARKQAGFELNPPRCTSCQHFRPPVHAVPGVSFYVAPACWLHDINVRPHSICDSWLGLDGQRLEGMEVKF